MVDSGDTDAPRVLIAGDSAEAVLFMSGTALAAGYAVILAESCARIADYFASTSETGRIDLLVLDGRRRASVAAYVLIALRTAGNRLPIVVISGGDLQFASDVVRLGATFVLDSPWRPQTLRRVLAALVPLAGESELPMGFVEPGSSVDVSALEAVRGARDAPRTDVPD